MRNYTSGPWVGVEDCFTFTINAENESVAFVPIGDPAGAANAVLIAAAPDLLEALEFISACAEHMLGNVSKTTRCSRDAIIRCAREAIAKATGEQQ